MTATAYKTKCDYNIASFMIDTPCSFVDKSSKEKVVRKFKFDVPLYADKYKPVFISHFLVDHDELKAKIERKWSQQYLTMLSSFMDNCVEVDEAMPVFHRVASALSHIPAKEIFVDYGRRERKVDFQIELEKGIHLSAVKPLSTNDDNLLGYTISYEGEILNVGCMDIDEFGIKIRDFIQELDKHV